MSDIAMHCAFLIALTALPMCVLAVEAPQCSTSGEAGGVALMQQQRHRHRDRVGDTLNKLRMSDLPTRPLTQSQVTRTFTGADALLGQACESSSYLASEVEQQWAANVLEWTADGHCDHMTESDRQDWIKQNELGNFDSRLFSTMCRAGKMQQFIEPIAGILRDPRFGCPEVTGLLLEDDVESPITQLDNLFSADWIVFPSADILNAGAKSRFFDAGGTYFGDSLRFFLQTYQAHGIVFDEVYVWEIQQQAVEAYWKDIPQEVRAFWEPRVTFYNGIGISPDPESEHTPVSRIFKDCAPEDFCVFKLDIDVANTEWNLVEQLVAHATDAPEAAWKCDEFYFEHHVRNMVMQPHWGSAVMGTFADTYSLLDKLRRLGIRAHSWV